jgi:uncharacterized membrane protein
MGGALDLALSCKVRVPLALQKIKPNGWYGFRTPKTLSDENIWYEANRVAGIDLSLAGLLTIFTSIALFLFSGFLTEKQVIITLVIVTIGSLWVAVIHSFIVLRRL